MSAQRSMNLDIEGKISEFERLMKEFMARKPIYKIIFRGKGLEFDSYRYYAPDDDSKDIDWKASNRANKLLVKQYVEERDLKIMFVVDVGENMISGSAEKLKCEYAAEVCAAFAHLVIGYGDKIGFVFFNGGESKIELPQSGLKQFEIFANELSNPLLYGGVSDTGKVLDFILDYFDDSISVIILVSDFIRTKKDIVKNINFLSEKFETIAIMIRDPLDETMPLIKGEVAIEDPATGEQIIVNPAMARKTYEKNAMEQKEMIKEIFMNAGADFLQLNTKEDFPIPLAEFLNERVKKGKYVSPKI